MQHDNTVDRSDFSRSGSQFKGTNKLGGSCAILTGVFFFSGLFSIVAYGTNPPTLMSQELPYISSHAALWELAYGSLLMASVFSLPVIIALYFALRNSNGALASTGALVAVVSAPIFLVGVVSMLSVVSLGNTYESATGTLQSAYLAASAASIGNGLLLQEVALLTVAAGTILLSVAMLKGSFGRKVGAVGILTGALTFPSVLSSTILAVVTILFAIWFILVGWRLFKFTA
jgi:hypothetical protein